ncbi:MAG: transaldolase [Anaerolineae bacterium]
MMTKLEQLASLGQSIWLDFIRRSLITSGELQSLVEEGLRGMTSNPTIFEKAIAGSNDYDDQLRLLVRYTNTVEELYEALALEDIRAAADVLRPVYERTGGGDGYVSLEVDPKLANDTQGTIAEARRLFAAVDRPNVMIKVPATPAGIPAIRALISEGLNINVTLIFSVSQYRAVVEAYMAGLESRAAARGDLSHVASVASFFVSRIDTAVDRILDIKAESDPEVSLLKGKTAIACAKMAYAFFGEIVSGDRWRWLASQGARVQRPLWASTSTKNPAYPDTLYVDHLIGPHTVNTLPPETLAAFRDHGVVAQTVDTGLEEARDHLARLAQAGIDLEAVTQKLQEDGVTAFAASFHSLLTSLQQKRAQLTNVG